MAYLSDLSLKYCKKVSKLMQPQIFFLKVVIDAIRMIMTFLFFAFFCMSIAPRITPQPYGSLTPDPVDYPPTLKICNPSLPHLIVA